jgi:hypothetical protein
MCFIGVLDDDGLKAFVDCDDIADITIAMKCIRDEFLGTEERLLLLVILLRKFL